MISDLQISKTLEPYGVKSDGPLCDRIRSYISLLLRWNEKISLTTITDEHEILRFHFGESFFAATAAQIQFGRLADVGSGAGFPGIPLAMIAPGLQVSLIESNVKKSAFLSGVARAVDLPNVSVLRSRMEETESDGRKFNFVTARALGGFVQLLAWSSLSLAESGKLILWLGGDDARKIACESAWSWGTPIQIPGSRDRFLLAGSPLRTR